VNSQEKAITLLERMVIAVEALTSSIMQQEGHMYLAAEQSQRILEASAAAAESGRLCAQQMLGAEEFLWNWEAWQDKFKAETVHLPWVVILGEDGKARTSGAKGKGKDKERDWEQMLDVEDAEGEEDEEDMEVDGESDRESEEV
jgi:hypothetical protein